MDEEVKLYGTWSSPFSRRVELALKMKGVEYKYFEEDLFNKKSSSLLKYNPVHQKVPAFVHDGRAIAESLVILEYIDDTWQNCPIMPEDPFERAQARFWARFMDDKCILALWNACWVKEDREKSIEEANELLGHLENELKDKKFLGGETLGLADLAGNFIAYWLYPIQEINEIEILNEERFPRLCQWSRELLNHDVVKSCLPPKDELKSYFIERYASFYSSK